MKRMITQELINLVEDMVKSGTIGDLIAQKVHLQDLGDLTISDLGALFPQASTGKILKWGSSGVLENADPYSIIYQHFLNITMTDTSTHDIVLLNNDPTEIEEWDDAFQATPVRIYAVNESCDLISNGETIVYITDQYAISTYIDPSDIEEITDTVSIY